MDKMMLTFMMEEFMLLYYANHRIQIFDPQGNFIAKFGEGGEGDGQFHKASAYLWILKEIST